MMTKINDTLTFDEISGDSMPIPKSYRYDVNYPPRIKSYPEDSFNPAAILINKGLISPTPRSEKYVSCTINDVYKAISICLLLRPSIQNDTNPIKSKIRHKILTTIANTLI